MSNTLEDDCAEADLDEAPFDFEVDDRLVKLEKSIVRVEAEAVEGFKRVLALMDLLKKRIDALETWRKS